MKQKKTYNRLKAMPNGPNLPTFRVDGNGEILLFRSPRSGTPPPSSIAKKKSRTLLLIRQRERLIYKRNERQLGSLQSRGVNGFTILHAEWEREGTQVSRVDISVPLHAGPHHHCQVVS